MNTSLKLQKAGLRLSYVLRHKPEEAGLSLTREGWAEVSSVLKDLAIQGLPVSEEELRIIVATNDKKRFSFDKSGKLIRANQGHSVKVDLGLKKSIPPVTLYHGTVEKFVSSILKKGLLPMSRHAVHLSATVEVATQVGARRGNPVILQVDCKSLLARGVSFYQSDNGVWLVEHVPADCIRRMV